MPILLLKYLPHLIIAALIISTLGAVGFWIHDNGRQLERGLWLQKNEDREAKEEKLVAKARANVMAEIEAQQNGLLEVINAQATLNNQLESDMHALSNKRMFVHTKPARCDSSGVPTQAKNPSKSSGGTNRIELSESFGKEVRDDYIAAQRVANQYLSCRQELMNIAEVEGEY